VLSRNLAISEEGVNSGRAGKAGGGTLTILLAMSQPDLEFHDVPQAYFITFRAYGTWLHGDERGSVDRNHNRFGSPHLVPNERRRQLNLGRLTNRPVRLATGARVAIEEAIKETCRIRSWCLWVVNARTNHVHAVVTAPCESKRVLNALKSNATRNLRQTGYYTGAGTPWAKRGSRKNLWTEQDVIEAVVYVQYEQGR
jgi:REP element-mobilizing transposase RayT